MTAVASLRPLRFLLAAPLLCAAFVVGAPVVSADCDLPPPIPQAIGQAEIVLVGLVVGLQNDDRWATVQVDEVWAGDVPNAVVEVRGGSGPGGGSSIDRTFAPDTRYLFFLTVSDGALTDNACTATTAWAADLARFRPATAAAPVGSGEPPAAAALDVGSIVVPVIGVGVVGIVVFGAVVALRPRR